MRAQPVAGVWDGSGFARIGKTEGKEERGLGYFKTVDNQKDACARGLGQDAFNSIGLEHLLALLIEIPVGDYLVDLV